MAHNWRKDTDHNLGEKSWTLGFQQENQDWKEKSATFIKGSQMVLYQILHYSIHTSERNSKYKNFSYNPKFQIQMLLFNMSGDIVTQTFAPSHKMVI